MSPGSGAPTGSSGTPGPERPVQCSSDGTVPSAAPKRAAVGSNRVERSGYGSCPLSAWCSRSTSHSWRDISAADANRAAHSGWVARLISASNERAASPAAGSARAARVSRVLPTV
ncbi:hypothetical protein [Streptomyces phaeoluteigriseus]|uniref:hypothetical protein n=1 Tax=Streptomyces phaeoluteigriseus TaxID=114686 RepID=UPI001FE6B7DE|nr:hypothetical protein [Streptomyces phaeoluteigriseus]